MKPKLAFAHTLLLLSVLSASVSGNNQKPLVLKTQNAVLSEAVEAVAKQSGDNVIVDAPEDFRKTDLNVKGNSSQIYTAIASAYGYEWKRSRSGIVLFRRSFRVAEDAPQCNVPQLRAVVKRVLGMFEKTGAGGAGDQQPSFDHLYRSLSAKQLQDLNEGKRLPVSALPSEQRQLVTSLLTAHTFEDTLGAFKQLNKHLASVQTSTLTFRPAVLPDGETGQELVHRFQGAVRMLELSVAFGKEAVIPTSQKASGKLQSDAASSNLVTGTMQTKALMTQLSKQLGETLQSDSELAGRRLYVRLQKVTVSNILTALAECEGWKWGRDIEDRWYLAPLSPKLPATLPEFSAYLTAVLPHDFQRFLRLGKPSQEWLSAPPTASDGQPTFEMLLKKIPDVQQSRRDRLFASLKRSSAKNQVIGFARLSAVEKNDLLTIHVWDCLFGAGNAIDVKLFDGKFTLLEKNQKRLGSHFV